MEFTDLDDDCLLKIFELLSDLDLINCCLISKRFKTLIEHYILRRRSGTMIITGHLDRPAIMDRTIANLSYYDRVLLHHNWAVGNYRLGDNIKMQKTFATRIHLEKKNLYVNCGNRIRRYRRSIRVPMNHRVEMEIEGTTESIIADFVKKDNIIFAGQRNGYSFIYDVLNRKKRSQQLHKAQSLTCVDFVHHLYGSGTKTCGKIWRRPSKSCPLELLYEISESIKVMKYSPCGHRLYFGLSFDPGSMSLRVFDMETGFHIILGSHSYSVNDIKIRDANTILVSTDDSTVRVFDIRSNRNELYCTDGSHLTYNCIEYDGKHGVLCGGGCVPRVSLFDLRQTTIVSQYCFTDMKPISLHAVNSIACDSQYLFVGTNKSLSLIDFYGDPNHFNK